MNGVLPNRALRFQIQASRTTSEPFVPRPPGPGEVVVEVAGSALGGFPGQEIAGRVVATGDAAAEWLGRRVVVPRLLPCGECDACRRGRVARCPRAVRRGGGVATHETLPARYLLSVEPPLWPFAMTDDGSLATLAALADAAALPYAGLVRAQLAPGDVCVVIGGGVRGRFAAALTRALGAHALVVDADPARRQAALAAGAHLAVDGESLDAQGVRQRLEEEARALAITALEPKILEATGTGAGRRRAVELAALTGGTAVFLGATESHDLPAGLHDLALGEGAVLGVAACHPDLYPELCALVVRGQLPLASAVRRHPFPEYAEALAGVRTGQALTLPILSAPAAAY